MNKSRCAWCGNDPLYMAYHDEEWGVPLRDDKALFEFLMLETFQAGLSWITILRKRENFRKAFDHFDYEKIAKYDEGDIVRLLSNEGIIRHRKKIEAAISNAIAFMEVQKEYGSFSHYMWSFVNDETLQPARGNLSEIPPKTELSDSLAKDLKKRGFKFVGSTVIYAHMQAVGMVNDHVKSCFRYAELGGRK